MPRVRGRILKGFAFSTLADASLKRHEVMHAQQTRAARRRTSSGRALLRNGRCEVALDVANADVRELKRR